MYGNRIGQNHFIQFAKIIDNRTVIKENGYLALLGLNRGDAADITVENPFVIVVANLHHLIIDTESAVAADDTRTSGVQYQLKLIVKIAWGLAPGYRLGHQNQIVGVSAVLPAAK